jgi:hypothetical protein
MDSRVLRAYGWDDIVLDYGFRALERGGRFSISEANRIEVLRRLTLLNQAFHSSESIDIGSERTSPAKHKKQKTFDFEPFPDADIRHANGLAEALDVVRQYLRTMPGWHTKGEIVSVAGISDNQWISVISDLIKRGEVERQGDRRGAKYRTIAAGDEND